MPIGGRPRPQLAPRRLGWSVRTVASILSNPRYTGRQVWNRQPTGLQLFDPADISMGHRQVQRWSLPEGWVISARSAHQELVSEADFIAAQEIKAARGPAPTVPAERRYLLAGLLMCGTCGRRMDSAWSSGRAAYRCRHGHTSAAGPIPGGRGTPTCARTGRSRAARAAPDAEPGRAPAVASAAHPERRRRPTCRQPAGRGKVLPRERDRPRLRPDRRNLECRQERYNRERHQESQLARASARERKEETLRQPALRQHTPGWKFSMPADKRSRGFDVSEGSTPRSPCVLSAEFRSWGAGDLPGGLTRSSPSDPRVGPFTWAFVMRGRGC